MVRLDKDGDGEVTKAEFRLAFKELFPNAKFEPVWRKLDQARVRWTQWEGRSRRCRTSCVLRPRRMATAPCRWRSWRITSEWATW